MRTLTIGDRAIDLDAIYTDQLRDEVLAFYSSREDRNYWAFNPKRAWSKFRRGVEQELELAKLVSRWIDLRSAQVLVIGSYLGSEAIAYALCGARVVGIDLDEQVHAFSRKMADRFGVTIDVRALDAADTGFASESFDYISCAQVLEHLPPQQQPRMLAEMWRLCKPGGLLWLDTPNQLAIKDHHDTGLPFIHWLPRAIKIPLAQRLGRAVPWGEPAFGNQKVHLHYYMSYFQVKRLLAKLGRHEILSRYRGYENVEHYLAARREQGRIRGPIAPVKAALLRGMLAVWDWNVLSGIRLAVRKAA